MIIGDEGRLLLFRYHDEHKEPFWSTVGGELKAGEDYVAAAERELREETGFSADIGSMVREHEAVYAVARSEPARWLERYFLVRCSESDEIDRGGWTDEERATIRAWRWWSLAEMHREPRSAFRPDWLPDLFESLVSGESRDWDDR